MKKTFLTCMAVLALFAIAGSAGAITCTIDQRPLRRCSLPRFAVSLNGDATIKRWHPRFRGYAARHRQRLDRAR
jgi:hypothetical protein